MTTKALGTNFFYALNLYHYELLLLNGIALAAQIARPRTGTKNI
jgi:hypothetical protein